MLRITPTLHLPLNDLHFTSIRSPGPGGQNVNKVATAILLRFNVANASLPEESRERLMHMLQHRLTSAGDLIIKANRFRTQERNKQDAIDRLVAILQAAIKSRKKRKKTKPTFSSVQKRLENKKAQGKKKSLRRERINHD